VTGPERACSYHPVKGYLIQTTLVLSNGNQVTIPVRLCAREETAIQVRNERQEVLAGILSAKLVVPRGGDEVDDTGLTFGGALAELGVMRFGTAIIAVELEDARIQIASKMPDAPLVRPS